MLKIYFADNYKVGQHSGIFEPLIENREIFKEFNKEIVYTIKECDVIISNRLDCSFTHSKKPIILCERYDSSCIGTSANYYNNNKVISVFKDYLVRDKSLLNSKQYKKRYHFNILKEIYNLDYESDKQNLLDEDILNKFKQVSWCLTYSHLNMNKHMKYCYENKEKFTKSIDIFCIFHIHGNQPGLKEHREHIKEIVSSIEGYNIVIGSDFGQTDYHNNLLKSKVCIAPWGLGERIALDQKGIISNCIIIKPDTDFVKTFPDIYREEYYTKCKLDLSDLKEICIKCLTNYDEYIVKTQKGNELLESIGYKEYVEHFCESINDVYKKK